MGPGLGDGTGEPGDAVHNGRAPTDSQRIPR
jgi:hypothetical protein